MKVTLSLTHQCNLACHYCYSGKAVKKAMTFETARKVVDFAFSTNGYEKKLDFCLFGGEPFLRFDLIQDITGYIRQKEIQGDKPAQISITTNGTLLTQAMIDFLLRERINLCFSIDGPAYVHDQNRVFSNGKGSATAVYKNLQKALEHLDRIQVNAVYGPNTLEYLPESVKFLHELGTPVIHLNPNICVSWTANANSKFQETYSQIGDYYIDCYLHGDEISVNLIDNKIILFLKDGYSPDDICGMGETEWGFAPSGNIYPCERFIGEDLQRSMCLGNIHNGIDKERQISIIDQRGNHNPECRDCHYSRFCMNWCGCTNYHLTGNTSLVSPMMCASERAAIYTARQVLETLLEENCSLFVNHLMDHFNEGRHYANS
ncbi:MAG: radical SAM protein [Gammaproteobacteria bacterium]|nr:radical SAM protein [Gammaproteobacteria bacterium]